MVNEEIVTALKNAVDRGEPLEYAVQVMINSRYNPAEVREAANYVSKGALTELQPKPEEELTMPSEKPGMLSRMFGRKKEEKPAEQLAAEQPQPAPVQEIPAPAPTPERPLAPELEKIKPRKKSHLKEILLLIMLLILIGILIVTILFRDKILGLFAG